MRRNYTSLLLATLFLMVLFMGSGCFSSANTRSAPERISTSEELPHDSDVEEVEEPSRTSTKNTVKEDPNDPRNNARQVRRQQQHRQSLNNVGSWLLVAAIGVGINILLAIVLSQ